MIAVGVLGLAYLAGVEPWRLALLAVVFYVAPLAIPLVVYGAFKGRSGVDDRAVVFCESVSSELRSGRSLRHAVESAATGVGVSVASPGDSMGLPWTVIIQRLQREFPGIRRELGTTIDASVRSGGGAAAIFDEIGSIAIAQAEITREVQTASAAARATAWFFLVAPTLYLAYQMRSRGLSGAFLLPQQRIAAAIGLMLSLTGLATVVFLMWRAR